MNRLDPTTISAFKDELSKIAFNDAHAARLMAAAGKRMARAAPAAAMPVAKSQGLTAGSRQAATRLSGQLGAAERALGGGAKPPPIPAAALRPRMAA